MVDILFDDVSVYYGDTSNPPAISGVSFDVPQGSRIGLVGETGSGKTTTALAIAGLLPLGASMTGSALVGDLDLVSADAERLRKYRVDVVGYVPQNAQSALNPVRNVAFSFRERARGQGGMSRAELLAHSRELLSSVEFPDPDRILRSYPHQLSGGMRQRVLIALALFGEPSIVVADEPTSGLDVSIQAGIIRLISGLSAAQSLVLITHDLTVAGLLCDTICVMYRGSVVEVGDVRQVLLSPQHEYTRKLIAASQVLL